MKNTVVTVELSGTTRIYNLEDPVLNWCEEPAVKHKSLVIEESGHLIARYSGDCLIGYSVQKIEASAAA